VKALIDGLHKWFRSEDRGIATLFDATPIAVLPRA